MVRDACTLCVIGVTNPSEKGLSILAGCTWHAFRPICAVPCDQYVFRGVLFSGKDIAIGRPAVLRLEQSVAVLVGHRPQRGVRCAVFIDALPRCPSHADDAHIGNEHPAVPSAHVDEAGSVLPILPLVHLQQPVRIVARRNRCGTVFVHAQPYTPVMAHAVIVVVVSALPCTPVVGGHYRSTVRFQLRDLTREEHVRAVHAVAAGRQAVDVQVGEVSYLEPYVGRTDLPCVLVHYHADVAACLVHARLA